MIKFLWDLLALTAFVAIAVMTVYNIPPSELIETIRVMVLTWASTEV